MTNSTYQSNENNDELELQPAPKFSPFQSFKQFLMSPRSIPVLSALSIIIIIVILASVPQFPKSPTSKRRIGLPELFNPNFSPKRPSVNFLANTSFLFAQDSSIFIQNTPTDDPILFLDIESLFQNHNWTLDGHPIQSPSYSSFYVSVDSEWIIIPTSVSQVYRHSRNSFPILVEMASLNISWISDTPQIPVQKYLFNSQASQIAYVSQNDIYLLSTSTSTVTQITSTGSPTFINGMPPWAYEEEIFESDIGMWFSPLGDQLAFIQSNTSLVQQYTLLKYDFDPQHLSYPPTLDTFDYPVPGTPISTVNLLIYDISNSSSFFVSDPGCTSGTNWPTTASGYYTSVAWIDSYNLIFKQMNRLQNTAETLYISTKNISISNITSNNCSFSNFIFSFSSPQHWVDNFPLSPTPTSGHWIDRISNGPTGDSWTLAKFNSTGFICHLPLSSSPNDVISISFLSDSFLWAQTSFHDNPTTRTVLKRSLDCSKPPSDTISLTDTVFSGNLKKYPWNTVQFSPNGDTFLHTFEGENTLPQTLWRSGTTPFPEIAIFEDNLELKTTLKLYEYPKKKVVRFDSLWTTVIYPPFFDMLTRDKETRFCVILAPYGGPTSTTVNTRFDFGFSQLLASRLNCLVFSIDGRGTGGRGIQFSQQVYENLGTMEAEDQWKAALSLLQLDPTFDISHPSFSGPETFSTSAISELTDHIDSSRIGIWGWSYGGFLTLRTLEHSVLQSKALGGINPFSLGVAVAPVTTWRKYDAPYTERYMGLNIGFGSNDPYYVTSVLDTDALKQLATDSHHPSLHLVHGLADDNVHPDMSFAFLEQVHAKLGHIDEPKESQKSYDAPTPGQAYPFPEKMPNSWDFSFSLFPNRNHGITGNGARQYVYKSIYGFIYDRFQNVQL